MVPTMGHLPEKNLLDSLPILTAPHRFPPLLEKLSDLFPTPTPYKNEFLPRGTNPRSEPCQFFPMYPWRIVSSPSPPPERAGEGRNTELEAPS